MKQLEKAIMCDKVLNENICGEEPVTLRKWRKKLKTIRSEQKLKKLHYFCIFDYPFWFISKQQV